MIFGVILAQNGLVGWVWLYFSGLRAHDVRGPLGTRSQGSHQRRAHLDPKWPRNRPQKSKIGPKKVLFFALLGSSALKPLAGPTFDRIFL